MGFGEVLARWGFMCSRLVALASLLPEAAGISASGEKLQP